VTFDEMGPADAHAFLTIAADRVAVLLDEKGCRCDVDATLKLVEDEAGQVGVWADIVHDEGCIMYRSLTAPLN